MTTLIYDEVRGHIHDGDALLFEGGRGLVSIGIMLGSRSKYSHVGMAFWVDRVNNPDGSVKAGRLFVLEAADGIGVRIYPLQDYINEGHKIDWHSLIGDANLDRRLMRQFGLRQIGHKYASLTRFFTSFGYRNIYRRLSGINPHGINGEWFCSALYAAAAGAGGFTLPKPSHEVTPGDVNDFVFLRRRGQLTLGE